MGLERFPLSTEQLELLLAFERHPSLSKLSELLKRDPSVISRNLQRLAEDLPVLKKQNGRWTITPLGRQVNEASIQYLGALGALLKKSSKKKIYKDYHLPTAALVIINAQKALLDPAQGSRNNTDAEDNIAKLLAHWRGTRRQVIHVRHVSDNPASAFYSKASSAGFIQDLEPKAGECVVEKKKSSAFVGTDLEKILGNASLDPLVITGFTANECIDATARQSSELGFTTYVVGDATATFDITGPEGRLIKADRIHRLTLANLGALYAKVVETRELLR